MAIIADGAQAFGLTEKTLNSLVVESLSINETSERVDLNDSDGEPIGSTVIPGRTEMSATVQVGSGTIPVIGGTVTIGSDTYILTDVSHEETQADYARVNISGYQKINA